MNSVWTEFLSFDRWAFIHVAMHLAANLLSREIGSPILQKEKVLTFFGKSEIIQCLWVMDISPVSKDELMILSKNLLYPPKLASKILR